MLRRILFLAVLTAPTLVWAQSAPAPAATPSASPNPAPSVRPLASGDAEFLQQQSELVRQLRLLTLQTQVAEQQKKLRDANAPETGGAAPATGGDSVNLPPISVLRPGSVPSSATPLPAMPNLPPVAAPAPSSGLSVASVWGVDGSYVADMLAPGGLRVSVRQGDALPGGWRVAKVLRTGVIVEKGRNRQTLMVGG